MTERDKTVMFSLNGDDGLPEQLETFDDFTPAEDRRPSGTANGLVSLGYLMGAIKRAARFLLALGIVGLLIGAAYDVKSPPAEKASTSVLITYGPDENPSSAVLDNQAIAREPFGDGARHAQAWPPGKHGQLPEGDHGHDRH